MKFYRKSGIPDNPDFEPEIEGGWMKLREPRAMLMQVYAMAALAIILPLLLLAWWWLLGPDSSLYIGKAVLAAVVLMVPLVVVHEGIHLLLHPGMGRSDQSVVGGSVQHGMLYALYFGEMSRERYVLILLGPFLVLTVLPWLVCLVIGDFVPWAAGISVLNGMFACGDLLGAWLILHGCPKNARMRNRGYYTWWRTAKVNASS